MSSVTVTTIKANGEINPAVNVMTADLLAAASKYAGKGTGPRVTNDFVQALIAKGETPVIICKGREHTVVSFGNGYAAAE